MDAPVVHMDGQKAKRFLNSLAREPFVAVVVEGQRVRVYTKGVNRQEAIDRMRILIEILEGEEDTEAAV